MKAIYDKSLYDTLSHLFNLKIIENYPWTNESLTGHDF